MESADRTSCHIGWCRSHCCCCQHYFPWKRPFPKTQAERAHCTAIHQVRGWNLIPDISVEMISGLVPSSVLVDALAVMFSFSLSNMSLLVNNKEAWLETLVNFFWQTFWTLVIYHQNAEANDTASELGQFFIDLCFQHSCSVLYCAFQIYPFTDCMSQ